MLRKSLALVGLLFLFGCHHNWYWVDGPRWTGKVDSFTHGTIYHYFTAIPYSLLDSSNAQVYGRDENGTLYYTVNRLLQDGFEYVDNVDSADFVLTECIRNDFGWHEDLDEDRMKPPALRAT